MITERALEILKRREFVSVGTADKQGNPNATPKLLLKIEKNAVYLIDYTLAKTVSNLRENPKASISFMDLDELVGYRMNGSVQLIEQGKEFQKILAEFQEKQVKLSASRVIEASRTGRKNRHYELEIPDKIIVIKVIINSVVTLGSQGDLLKEGS